MSSKKGQCAETESLDELIAMMDRQIGEQVKGVKSKRAQPKAEQPAEG